MLTQVHRAQVMIVNVNPYDTGFDENSHVMRFSALAREVSTVPGAATTRTLPAGKARGSEVVPHRRSVTLSTGGPGKKASEAHLEVLEGPYPYPRPIPTHPD